MHDPISIERIGGVDVRMDWSWPILVLAFLLAVASAIFGTHPDWSIGLSVGLAGIATLGLVASLVVREAIQVFVARRLGAPIGAVTVFLAGSAPVYVRTRRSAVREALVATIGPLVLVVLGLLFLTAAGLVAVPLSKLFLDPAGVLRTLPPAATVLAWIGLWDLAVAALDALPAYPLAGGRVLRSIVWEATGNYRLATNVAATIGQGVALLLLLVGLASAFRLGPRTIAEGVWLTLVGWVLLHAATSSIRSATVDDALTGVPVSRLMRPIVRMITPDAPLAVAAVQHFVGTSARALPVVQDEGCVGMLRYEDLRKIPPREWADRPVRDAMMPMERIPRIQPSTQVGETLRALVRSDAQVAPVIDRGELVGVIEAADILRWIELAEVEPALGPEPEESIDWDAAFRLPRLPRLPALSRTSEPATPAQPARPAA